VFNQADSHCTHLTCFNRSITAKNFLTSVRNYLEKHHELSPILSGMITCKKDHTMKELIQLLDSEKVHRIYVVDDDGNHLKAST